MSIKIFPSAITQQTVEVYDSRISVRSKVIYLILIGLMFASIAALPLIYVDVAVQSRGTFQSALQRNSLISSVGGRLEKWSLVENQKVQKGEVLAVVRAEVVQLEMNGVEERLILLNDFIEDLRKLLNMNLDGHSIHMIPLKSKFYQTSLLEFQTKIHNQAALMEKLERDFNRAQLLFDSKSIAFADFDNTEVQYKQAITQMELLKKQQLNNWEQEMINHQNEKLRLKSQMDVFTEQMDQYKIIAGTNGTLINVLNLNVGDFIYPQQKLAEISPDTTLIAVTYISPIDIAFLNIGQEVNFQVDAYNYNQWGVAKGKVIDIADDLTLVNEREAGFLVTCTLDTPFLTISNGLEGQVKKGMTFNARFVVARRSLFQLLYDKVDNWLNPQIQQPS
ncbi:HlyD family secretion protein [Arthrospiribacter ruber]|uniref:HlyD family efflux transporter periplasmic adaptor subunit n=1 Tax=Arthrospiribacter ruber TaxID=2487934 RepID=A0A951ITA1_9BACT|nr:HlyD family efflux transporter periplasmic adaptor subunit [Arthrospiribacter ruber]MBW3466252.1 HlyD family efflux transporter periplasmic adaptor subunit [Arthrospiribacter ruber]